MDLEDYNEAIRDMDQRLASGNESALLNHALKTQADVAKGVVFQDELEWWKVAYAKAAAAQREGNEEFGKAVDEILDGDNE